MPAECLPVCASSLATWLLFTAVPAWCVVLLLRCPRPLGSHSPVCLLGVLCCVCNILGHLAPVQQCARSMCCFACAVSWVTWVLFTGVPAWLVVLPVRCPGPLSSCSPVCPLGVLPAFAVSWATWLLFAGVPARHVVLRVRCPGPLGSCSPVCLLGVLCCVCGLLGPTAPVQRCAHSVRCFARAMSWATWFLFTGVPARCVTLFVRCPGPVGSRSPVCPLGVYSVCAVSWAAWRLFAGLPARCVVLRVRCPGPLGSCSAVCQRGAALRVRCAPPRGSCSLVCPCGLLCCVWSVLGHLTLVHRCARSVCCFACAVSWATWLLFTGVPAWCVVLRVRCPGPLGSCSPVCPLGMLFCLCGVVGHLAPFHRCARSVCCLRVRCPGPLSSCSPVCPLGACPFVRCPGPLGSCSPLCPLGALFCSCGVPGHLAPIHLCACSVCCVACAISWATWLLFTGVPALCIVLRVQCLGPLGSCSPVRSPGVLWGVLGHLAPVHRCARSVCSAVGCVCRVSLWGAHSSIRPVAFCSRQRPCTPGARTPPSGRRPLVAGRGWVPSGRTRVHRDGGCSVAGGSWVR